ncbi:MAG: dienelactone hydrolase [Verrucomicrobia bacterium]|nr:dienelactone hydrolase [Verrucomicrobiota bacterium]
MRCNPADSMKLQIGCFGGGRTDSVGRMPQFLRWCAVLLFGLLVISVRAEQTFDVEVARQSRETFDKAAFHLWLPDNAPPVRGVAVVLDGINVDGRHLAGRVQWQNFARDHSFALVACYLYSDDLTLPTYCEADRGSGRALLAGLAALGKASRHPELENVPLYLLGFSAGGQFSYSFACFRPDRTAAFVSNKGGIYLTPATAAAREIPGLFIVGEKDTATRRTAARKVYLENRKLGAKWCMASEPNRGHQTAYANDLALPFFEAVMKAGELPASERAGIVLDLEHKKLIAPGVPPKEAGLTFWFPDEPTMAVWNKFMTTPK